MIQNSFNGQNHAQINASKAFQAEIAQKANEIVESLIPEMLRPIIMKAAKELAENADDVLKKPDSVTRDVMASEKSVYMRLLFKVANACGRGASWLQ